MTSEILVPKRIEVQPQGMRKNGKQWHEPKAAFRPRAGNQSYEKRVEARKAMALTKAKEKEMKEEKEDTRLKKIEVLRAKKAAKEEKARYEKLSETMHKKRLDRLKRREKRNKMLKS
ncbi:unnamed protein product [Blumeria hordei]|uniref:rRNA-processing protein n=1 Tax=Blumeria hordei TaxID=2867405 RepID=A0A383UX93_BLUHO|nr:unnamed protein product [Blumeria hordei]